MEMKFYRCKKCGQMVGIVEKKGCPIMCCNEAMEEVIPGTTDAAAEKHVPVVKIEGNTVSVCVGEVAHPMLAEHYIEWIAIQTKEGNQRKALQPGDEPQAVFALTEGDELEAAYAYCNLHSLWKA